MCKKSSGSLKEETLGVKGLRNLYYQKHVNRSHEEYLRNCFLQDEGVDSFSEPTILFVPVVKRSHWSKFEEHGKRRSRDSVKPDDIHVVDVCKDGKLLSHIPEEKRARE